MQKLIALAALSLAMIARSAHAAPVSVTPAMESYCHAYAESEYNSAVARGDGLPDAAYEGAQEECETQWIIVASEWNDDDALDAIAIAAR